jgi:hypothetical protein
MKATRLLLVDAAFEGGLAVTLLAGTAGGWLSGNDFAAPASTEALLAVALCLALLACALLSAARQRYMGRWPMLGLSFANECTALVALVWVLTGRGFSPSGEVISWVTITALAALSVLQLRAAIRQQA